MTGPSQNKVCVIGIWHLGLVTSVCLADMGFDVVGVDADGVRIERLNEGQPPIYEPGIEALLTKSLRERRLRYTTELLEGVRGADHVLIAFDTPVNDQDEVDLTEIFRTFEILAGSLEQGATVTVSSQVPVGTCEALSTLIRTRNPNLRFNLACVPENLRLGQAIERFRHPDMIVIGSETEAGRESVERLYAGVDAPRVSVDLPTAEMTKHAINAYLATSITLGNELANLCDLVGADASKVVEALRLEARVSPRAPLAPGLGFSGGTLARDMKVLQKLAQEHDYEAPLINGVLQLNALQNQVVIRSIQRFYGTWDDLQIGVLGLTYKPGTSTLRRSAAVEMIRSMASAGARVRAYDPMADPREVEPHLRFFSRCESAYEVAEGAQALVLATPWPEFNQLDFHRLQSLMRTPFLIDPNNVLNPGEMARVGFIYQGVGRGNALRAGTTVR